MIIDTVNTVKLPVQFEADRMRNIKILLQTQADLIARVEAGTFDNIYVAYDDDSGMCLGRDNGELFRTTIDNVKVISATRSRATTIGAQWAAMGQRPVKTRAARTIAVRRIKELSLSMLANAGVVVAAIVD